MKNTHSLVSVEEMRTRARKHVMDGAVTADYKADRKKVLKMLNESLATELVCVLRYRRHYFTCKGIHAHSVAAEFLEHSNEELGHADLLAARIVQLGGEPDFAPDTLLSRSHAEYVEGKSLQDFIIENLVAERVAIESYRQFVEFLGDADPTTRRLVEGILATEEEHADELADMLQRMPKDESHVD